MISLKNESLSLVTPSKSRMICVLSYHLPVLMTCVLTRSVPPYNDYFVVDRTREELVR